MTLGADGFKEYWMRGWMHFAGRGPFGRFATRLATWFAPPLLQAKPDWRISIRRGYVAPSAAIDHSEI